MKRRKYLASLSSTAFLPILDTVDIEPPEVSNIEWLHSIRNDNKILRVKTTQPVDEIRLTRYAYGETSNEPTHNRVDTHTHELVWDKPTTVTGLHSFSFLRNGQKIHKTLLDLQTSLLTRHIQANPPRAGRVAVKQEGDAALALLNRAIVTEKGTQPDFEDVEFRNKEECIWLCDGATKYITAHVTHGAGQAMRGHQTVWVWTKTETGAMYPATVDFTDANPVDIYEINGVRRY